MCLSVGLDDTPHVTCGFPRESAIVVRLVFVPWKGLCEERLVCRPALLARLTLIGFVCDLSDPNMKGLPLVVTVFAGESAIVLDQWGRCGIDVSRAKQSTNRSTQHC